VRCHAAANDAVGDRGREYAYRAPVVPGMDVTQLAAYRANKDEFLGCSPHSPLSPETRRGFTGLRYFEPNPQLVFDLAVTPGDGTSFRVETSDGASRMYARNLITFIERVRDQETGDLAFDLDDEIIGGSTITYDGRVVHPRSRQLLGLEDSSA